MAIFNSELLNYQRVTNQDMKQQTGCFFSGDDLDICSIRSTIIPKNGNLTNNTHCSFEDVHGHVLNLTARESFLAEPRPGRLNFPKAFPLLSTEKSQEIHHF